MWGALSTKAFESASVREKGSEKDLQKYPSIKKRRGKSGGARIKHSDDGTENLAR